MPKFTIETILPIENTELSNELLNMAAMNYELFPLVRMTVKRQWNQKELKEWPVNQNAFNSIILLLGVIPVDIHYFRLSKVTNNGFNETSKSLLNSQWNHSRVIQAIGAKSKIIDVVEYQSRIGILSPLFKPVYQYVFKHRHNRLKRKYS